MIVAVAQAPNVYQFLAITIILFALYSTYSSRYLHLHLRPLPLPEPSPLIKKSRKGTRPASKTKAAFFIPSNRKRKKKYLKIGPTMCVGGFSAAVSTF